MKAQVLAVGEVKTRMLTLDLIKDFCSRLFSQYMDKAVFRRAWS